ncbi:hypothetical protein CLV92_102186 [Kineococcus xinjiangensis]|uniref:Uncharacterized protein n=1 Tax=Kineococcus xinjiangensis TaxID=512762 RepID=A0A2S6IV55_9ACTN|nr:hypothetical protein [Kineococcus xinjiangensis]PPK98033.1 hypothetical protein CLV92_102186 [Kineococcus xinjiangensis]
MSLAIFGLFLLGALVAVCWKDTRATFVAVVAVMLGLTVAGSDGALAGVSQSLVSGVRAALDGLGGSLFGA